MSLFEIPKWETNAAAEALNNTIFKYGSTKAKKIKNANKLTSLVDRDSSVNKIKKKTKIDVLKKLVHLKNNDSNKESINVKKSKSSPKKAKSKNLLKHKKANNTPPENIRQNFVAAPPSSGIKKQKKKRKRFKKITNEDNTLSREKSLPHSKVTKDKLNYSEISEPNALKMTPKKRKRLHSESAVPLLKTAGSSPEEMIKPPKQKKLRNETNTTTGSANMPDMMEPVKSPYNILKLKAIFAKTPPSNRVNKKSKVAVPLRERMMQKLQASHFRYLNEQLYTSQPKEAQELFRNDPELFQAYHDGYQQQVQRWPLNPLDVIIKSLLRKPAELVIADFGCGDAQLARSLPNKVHSFDLVALSDEVIACNMAHTPLSNASVDVIVFCLSLMGTCLKEFLTEANRVLKEGGLMKIAEVESRFDNVEQFIVKVQKYGFTCTWKDLSHNLFYFMDFKKEQNIGKKMKKKLPELTLKPCLYKKR